MLLPFIELQRQVQAKIQNTGTDTTNDNDLTPKVRDWINTIYARVYRSFPWRESIDDYDLTLTASQVEYVFDRDVGKVITIFDETNGRVVAEDIIENHNREHATDLDKVGNIISNSPTRYRLSGMHTVKNSVGATAETVDIVSSSALDVSPNVIRVEGFVDGVEIGENIVVTGTTAATSTNTFDAAQRLRISASTSDGNRKTLVGKITVSGTTSSTTYAEISPAEYAHAYQWFKVSPTPTATGTQPTWEITYQKQFRRLDNDQDIPIFDCCIELIQGAFADALKEDGLEQEGNIAEQKFIVMTKELQSSRKITTRIEQFKPVETNNSFQSITPYNWL